MTVEPQTITEDTPLKEIVRLMEQKRIKRLPAREEVTWAIRNQASALAMVASKSLARRRLRSSQAKVLSMTQRLGSGLNVPTCSER